MYLLEQITQKYIQLKKSKLFCQKSNFEQILIINLFNSVWW